MSLDETSPQLGAFAATVPGEEYECQAAHLLNFFLGFPRLLPFLQAHPLVTLAVVESPGLGGSACSNQNGPFAW
jgi:hypothetical protein